MYNKMISVCVNSCLEASHSFRIGTVRVGYGFVIDCIPACGSSANVGLYMFVVGMFRLSTGKTTRIMFFSQCAVSPLLNTARCAIESDSNSSFSKSGVVGSDPVLIETTGNEEMARPRRSRAIVHVDKCYFLGVGL